MERSELLSTMLAEARRRLGKESAPITANDHLFSYIGVHLPYLALRYLLQADIWPLNKLILLYGDEDSCKTTFALKVGQLFMQSFGHVVYIDGEHKFPSDIATSLLGGPLQENVDFDYAEVYSADEAQAAMQTWIKYNCDVNEKIREHNEEVKKAGEGTKWPESPLLIIFDSLASALSSEEIAALEKDGYGSARIAVFAKKWATPIIKLSNDLANSNATIIIINHEKREPGMYGARTIVGGKGQKFLSFLSLRMSSARGSNSLATYTDHTEKWIKMYVDKNGMGASRRELETCLVWDTAGNFDFDLETSAVELLKENSSIKDLALYRKKYNCATLGLKGATSQEVLTKLLSEPEVYKGVCEAWGIKSRTIINEEFLNPEDAGGNQQGEHEDR